VKKKIDYFIFIILITVSGFSFFYWYKEVGNRVGVLYSTLDSSYKLETKSYNLKTYTFNENSISEKEFKYLKSKGINFVVGPIYSENGYKIFPFLEKYDFLSFSPTISSDSLLKSTERIFTLTPSNEMQIDAILNFLKKRNISNVLIVIDPFNQTYSKEYLRILDQINGSYIYYYGLNSIIKTNFDYNKYDAILITTASDAAVGLLSFLEQNYNGIFILTDSALDVGLTKFKGNKSKVYLVSFTNNPFNETLDLIYETLNLISSHKFLSAQQAIRFFTNNKFIFNQKRTLNREIKIVKLSDF